jgi:plastocyanin
VTLVGRWTAIVTLAGAVACAAAPGVSADRPPRLRVGATVAVQDNYFDPRSVSDLEPGESVRWVWRGDNRHNLRFRKAGNVVKRRVKARSNGFAFRAFATAGVYRYYCSLYDGMEGTVTVTSRKVRSPTALPSPTGRQ